MNTQRVRSVVPVFAAIVTITGCTAGSAEQAEAPPPPAVTAARVVLQDLKDWADFTGRLEAASLVEVRPRVGGYVESVHFEEGGRVEQGQLLFLIDPRPFEAEVARLSAERERARAELEVARSYRDRAERLLAQKATSREEFERLAADAAVAEAMLASVEAALEAAQLDLSYTRVTAPISGRVSRALVKPGNLVDGATLLTTLVADDPIHAYFDVDEHTYLELMRGAAGESTEPAALTAFVGLANEEGYPHVARLDFVDNHVDPDQGTIRARAVLSNENGKFTPGLFARIKVVGDRTYRAALVEERAIGTDLDRKYVLIVDENGVAQYRPVELGRSIDGLRVVKSGLSVGDRVIVNGLARVRPGMAVAASDAPAIDGTPFIERFAAADQPEATASARAN